MLESLCLLRYVGHRRLGGLDALSSLDVVSTADVSVHAVANPCATELRVDLPFIPTDGGAIRSRFDVIANALRESPLMQSDCVHESAHHNRIGYVLERATSEGSILGIHPSFLFMFNALAIDRMSWNSVHYHRDAPERVCSICGKLNVVHIHSCIESRKLDVCLFCCGCYSKARAVAAAQKCMLYHSDDLTSPAFHASAYGSQSSRPTDSIAFLYGSGLVQNSAICSFRESPVYAFPDLKVNGTSGESAHLPLPSWCDGSNGDSDILTDGSLPRVTLDSRRAIVVEMHLATVNHVEMTVPICNCDEDVATCIRRAIANPNTVEAPATARGYDLLRYLVIKLRRSLQAQDSEGLSRLPHDHACCIHVRALVSALDQRAKAVYASLHDSSVSTAAVIDANVNERCRHARAEIGYLSHCGAYCVNLLNGTRGMTVCIFLYSGAFCCPGSLQTCQNHRRRCEHLRAIGDYIRSRRESQRDFVLGSHEQDDLVLQQVFEPRSVRSCRTPEDAFRRLAAFSKGPYPLTLLRANPAFVCEVNHNNGWATELIPDSPSTCNKCNSSLGKPTADLRDAAGVLGDIA